MFLYVHLIIIHRSSPASTTMSSFTFHFVRQLTTLIFLFLVLAWEFYVTVTGHALIFRSCMCFTVFLFITNIDRIVFERWYVKKHSPRTDETFHLVWELCCLVGLYGLCIVNGIHAIQMLSHRHDSGVHYPRILLGSTVADFMVKVIFLVRIYLSTEYQRRHSWWSPILNFCFYTNASLFALVIAGMRFGLAKDQLTLILDPSFTIVSTVITCLCALPRAKKVIRVLLLFLPKSMDIASVRTGLDKEFPELSYHDLHLWQESNKDVIGTIHVELPSSLGAGKPNQLANQLAKIRQFFTKAGVSQITIQIEKAGFTSVCDPCADASLKLKA